ncbi:MAG: acyl-CoA dehydrogenase family protein [Janthinobacterium lividum]
MPTVPASKRATDGPADRRVLDDAARAVLAVAMRHANDVDRIGRFPAEAVEAMKQLGLLGAMLPRELGGQGASLAAVASACRIMGHGCASAAMVFAMHQIQVACLLRHAVDEPWHRSFLEQSARHQWLMASATSEDAVGGNLRNSGCAVEFNDGVFTLNKLAPTISYGAHADVILATARRGPTVQAADQVLVTLLKGSLTLTRRGGWDALGMRGTCSESFALAAHGTSGQIFKTPFSEIADRTMVPVSHILWSAVWLGIASDSLNQAQRYFRSQAQSGAGALPPSAHRLAAAFSCLRLMSSRIDASLDDYADATEPLSWANSMAYASGMNALKTSMSTTALQIVQESMQVCGMAAYKNDSSYSLGRHLRDVCSAPLMINNDRIDLNTANLLLAQRFNSPETGL